MSSLWELSTDTVVTTLIVVGISALVLAWLFAGRRRPTERSGLEQRRLAGREAEVYEAPMAPSVSAAMPEMDPDPAPSPDVTTPIAEAKPVFADEPDTPVVEQLVTEAPEVKPAEPSAPTLILEPVQATPDPEQVLEPEPAATTSTPRSAEQASAMSIAAALVRHDKRDPTPSAGKDQVTTLQPAASAGGDDLTAINGIDGALAKEMNDLGVRYFDQIGDWSPDHAAWITSRLSSSVNRAQRNAWIAEAKALADQPPASGPSRASQGR